MREVKKKNNGKSKQSNGNQQKKKNTKKTIVKHNKRIQDMIGGHFLISYPCTMMIIGLCWNILKNMLVIVYDDVRITRSNCIYIRCVKTPPPYLFLNKCSNASYKDRQCY